MASSSGKRGDIRVSDAGHHRNSAGVELRSRRPGEAYSSLRYIVTELTGGQLIRGLHHWGASLMIIVVVLHMGQVFLWGAYKKPREATWMVEWCVLLLTLAYGRTGYLLALGQSRILGHHGDGAYRIGALPPSAGPACSMRLLGSDGGSIGAVTFTRFYAAHVLLLPPLTLLLVALQRVSGAAPAASRRSAADLDLPKKKFYPEQVFKDTVATFVWFAISGRHWRSAVQVHSGVMWRIRPISGLHPAARVVFPVSVPVR